MREKPRGGTFGHVLGFSSTLQRGDKRTVTFFWPFCTFWTRVAITAPRRPKRTKPGSKAVWVLGNQPVAGFARRFGRLARQHVRCGAHMCLFQGQKSALGARSYICCQRRFTASLWAQTKVWVYDHRVTLRNSPKHALQRIGVENRYFMRFQVRRRNLGRGGRAFWVGQAEFARRSRLEEAWEWVCCERL